MGISDIAASGLGGSGASVRQGFEFPDWSHIGDRGTSIERGGRGLVSYDGFPWPTWDGLTKLFGLGEPGAGVNQDAGATSGDAGHTSPTYVDAGPAPSPTHVDAGPTDAGPGDGGTMDGGADGGSAALGTMFQPLAAAVFRVLAGGEDDPAADSGPADGGQGGRAGAGAGDGSTGRGGAEAPSVYHLDTPTTLTPPWNPLGDTHQQPADPDAGSAESAAWIWSHTPTSMRAQLKPSPSASSTSGPRVFWGPDGPPATRVGPRLPKAALADEPMRRAVAAVLANAVIHTLQNPGDPPRDPYLGLDMTLTSGVGLTPKL